MASLDAKLMGDGKKENYVSSSESEGEGETPPSLAAPVRDGLPQTGPKGVLTDFYRNQREQKQRQILEEQQRRKLIAKHTATVQGNAAADKEASGGGGGEGEDTAMANLTHALEGGTLDADPFLQEYRAKRLGELKQQAKRGSQRVIFGHLLEVRGDKYATVIDTAPSQTLVLLHIYDEFLPVCQQLNTHLTKLAKTYPTAKFCRVQSYQVGVSEEFTKNALPALLVYKEKELVGNLLRITDTLGQEYSLEDLEAFLQEKHCLPPESEKEEVTSHKLLGSFARNGSDSD